MITSSRYGEHGCFLRCAAIQICLTLLLTGCMNVATTGAQAFYNRHSLQKSIDDQYATMQIYRHLNDKTHEFENTNISIATYNGDVLLAGEVPNAWQKARAGNIARNVPNVKEVYNMLAVKSPSSVITRMSDAWITAKIKSKLIASEDLDATQIKVVTENGVVYLMGVLPPDEAKAAAELASDTSGVKQVVKIFSYVHITKTLS